MKNTRTLWLAMTALAATAILGLALTGCPNGQTAAKYTVTFDMHGGSTVPAQLVAYGGFATVPSPAPTRTGYTLTGWYTTQTGGTAFNFAATPITGSFTVHAWWAVQLANHTVTFNTYGGGTVASQTVVHGGFAAVPNPAPTRTGYNFTGWLPPRLAERCSTSPRP